MTSAAAANHAGSGMLFRFGVIADPQYAAAPPANNRFYANGLSKLREAVVFFNSCEELQFVVTLGDTIDHGWHNYDDVLGVYDALRSRRVFVVGNHDFQVAEDWISEVPGRLGLTSTYYDFAVGTQRFIIIDGSEVSVFASPRGTATRVLGEARLAAMLARGELNAMTWNGGMSETQFAWLEEALDRAEAAGEKVIIMGHFPVYPFTDHSMWDSGRFVELVTRYEAFAAYFCGHYHFGNYGGLCGKHFVNFKGMVETAAETAYALVEVYPDRIDIIGRGSEPSRSLAI